MILLSGSEEVAAAYCYVRNITWEGEEKALYALAPVPNW